MIPIIYLIVSAIVILLLTTRQKNYWTAPSGMTLTLKREVLVCLICFGLSYASIEFHKKKERNHTQFSIGSLDQKSIDQINYLDRKLAGTWDLEAKRKGKVFKNVAIYLIPVSLLLFIGSLKGRLILFFIFSQGYVLTETMTGLAKELIDRYRPFAYLSNDAVKFLNDESKEEFLEDIVDYDILNSFFSGDASIVAFSFTFFAFSYSSCYGQSKLKPLIWIVAVSSISLGCYYRTISGKHFPTDVLIGALVGAFVAFFILGIHQKLAT